ncbi:hypothetical protein GPECTOR_71g589 [Gonium pectorale]|uniref:GH16 domain-containing protein n=1 Tax=Gonium pectorale TaxID=33097 RepID=A0A150G313_GONPE|nr:hypothetical protein GPECTOR_71g589 [Gonium pectorale]|eukprot:KXZ44228.1 hypothetical protein GPECTOR_71g589 [Gonium pectorale]
MRTSAPTAAHDEAKYKPVFALKVVFVLQWWQGCSGPTSIWADEFDGTALDATSWNYYLGAAWGNELQFYTNRTDNVRLEDGHLVVEARTEQLGDKSYTSGRIDTRLKQAFYPGMATAGGGVASKIRFEARMKLPEGQGLWPAFWLAPNSKECDACGPYGAWPYSGEIDIVEAINDMTYAFGTLHFGGFSSGGTFYNQGHWRPTSYKLANEWHTYAFEWAADQMWWFIDDVLFYTTHSHALSDEGWWTSSQTGTPTGPNSPFDAPFYIILNLAVGGDWPGPPDATTPLPAQLLVDYIRVLGYS